MEKEDKCNLEQFLAASARYLGLEAIDDEISRKTDVSEKASWQIDWR